MSDKVSFIVCARNEQPEMIRTTIARLKATTSDLESEIILIDDASSAPVAQPDPDVLLIRNSRPIGCARSRRLGSEAASGSVLVWLDAHMTFGPRWAELMLDALRPRDLVCATWWEYDLSHPLCWGADFTWTSYRDYSDAKYPGFGFIHRTCYTKDCVVEVPMVIGACYMMHRSTYERIGGLTRFRVWGLDEQDISLRTWLTGGRVKCVTGAAVGHFGRPSFPYEMRYDYLEFNQIALIRSLFTPLTSELLERAFHPKPEQIQCWVNDAKLSCDSHLQRNRELTDEQVLAALIPAAYDFVRTR